MPTIRRNNAFKYIARETICNGCYTYGIENEECEDSYLKDGVPCPCSLCLIKMMCVKECKILGDYDRKKQGD